MEIQYWISGHEHPLRLREDAGNHQFTCQICNSPVESALPFYACHSCTAFYAHKSCVTQLPHQIQHPFHPHSPLTFLPQKSTWCDSCRRDFKDAQFYRCHSCYNFRMCVECALMSLAVPSSSSEGRDWIGHFGHPHPLLLRVDHAGDHIKCFGCQSSSSGGDHQAFYGCSNCHYFLHKSCAELPQKIYLPVHRNHRGDFVLRITGSFQCKNCRTNMEDRYNFRFVCERCLLWICFKCAGVTRSRNIEYEDHQHLLCLVENVEDSASLVSRCNGYDSYCTQRIVMSSDEFKKTESSMLWCFYCGFKLHLLCAPLPAVIRHEFHIHSLILVDSLAEDESGEYYCDVCETKRDPRIRLYCCQDCKYFAHIHCVIPEVAKVLMGDHRDVELKTAGHDIWNVPGREFKIDRVGPANMTLKDLINELSDNEKDRLRRYYKWNETSSQDQKGKQEDRVDDIEISNSFKVGDEEIDEILQLSHFTDGSFRTFWSNLYGYYNRNTVELKSSDLAMKIVKVNGYMIPHSLAAVLNSLLCEFGDIGRGANESLRMKSIVYIIVCKVVKRMHSTMPECITKNLLQEWYYRLRFANRFDFKVEFARKQLEKLVHAFLGFQAKRLNQEIPNILTQKIAELQQKLDECNEIRGSSSKSEYQEYCFNMASEFKWKHNAFGGLSTQKLSTEDSRWVDGLDRWYY